MSEQLHALHGCGQSVWLDFIRRNMFASGELDRLIKAGVRGQTSNPTIFEKAIGSGNDYDEQLKALIDQGEVDPTKIFESLAIADIRNACDAFRALFEESGGGDGFVSLEVSPLLAHDTDGTVAAAKRLWAMVDRPNVMIKIPGTKAGRPAITAAIEAGINVNVTLLFSVESYEAAAEAFIEGLSRRAERGEPVDRIASVASVFVSRIDTAVDKMLAERTAKGNNVEALVGQTAVANTKLIYERFTKLFGSEKFNALRAKGAHPQRPLWASTGTKNPQYSDLLYVESLVAHDTVNTMPPATLDALMDHGKITCDTISNDVAGARSVIASLAKANISLFDVTQALEDEGVKSFADSFNAMLGAISSKMSELSSNQHAWVAVSPGNSKVDVDADLKKAGDAGFLQKLWGKDPAPWSSEPDHVQIIKNALGWLDFPDRILEDVDDLTAFGREIAQLFKHVVVMGMGGSSLAPDVLRSTFGVMSGFPELHVLDSSDPDQIKALEDKLDLTKTLFVVASKSGTTTEPDAFFRYFFDRVQKAVGAAKAGSQFIAITDPATALVEEAKRHNFRRVFINDPTIGGRYSALSYFGMVPAALAGYDVRAILDRGTGALHSNSRVTPIEQADAVRFGVAIAQFARAGRNKLTIVCHPWVAAFGMWAEQLIAESTGKSGTGIIPIEGETLGSPSDYGNDRVFVFVGAGLPPDRHVEGEMDGSAIQTRLDALSAAGHPVILLGMEDRFDVGEQFALWEIATAAAGSVLGIDPFDQPNVQESKENTKRLLAEFRTTGSLPEPEGGTRIDGATIYALSGSSSLNFGSDLASAFAALVSQVQPGDYIAMMAYLNMDHEDKLALRDIRLKFRDALRVATTLGFGPRFLHSTGQLHKGGPATGVFIQITTDKQTDLQIPGMVSFRTLERAQALGDFEALDKRNRRGLRIHLAQPLQLSLATLSSAVDDAVAAKA
jgi:transaldolase/glucose-6-phosphate isomerase